MASIIEYADTARRQLQKLDRAVAQLISRYLRERVAPLEDPRAPGQALSGPLGDLWRYRAGHYRLIADLQRKALTVLVLRVAHRRDIDQRRP